MIVAQWQEARNLKFLQCGFESHQSHQIYGKVAERFKVAVLKIAEGESPPGVRIPPFPMMCQSGGTVDAVVSKTTIHKMCEFESRLWHQMIFAKVV